MVDAHVWWSRNAPPERLKALRAVGVNDMACGARWHELEQNERDLIIRHLNEAD